MSLELVNTAATLGTFVVIAATAVTAVIALRHARSSNQIAALNELRAGRQTESFVNAPKWSISSRRPPHRRPQSVA